MEPVGGLLRCWHAQLLRIQRDQVNIDNGFGAGFVASLINGNGKRRMNKEGGRKWWVDD